MTLVTRLVGLIRDGIGAAAPAEPDFDSHRLAAAALLVHVARVDGQLSGPERVALLVFLADRFGLEDGAAAALVARADRLDREVDDVALLIEMLGREADEGDRRRLMGMAFGIAAADGEPGEFEDALLWRMGHLLRFDDDVVASIRADGGAVGRGREGA